MALGLPTPLICDTGIDVNIRCCLRLQAAAEGAVGIKRPHAEPTAFAFHVPGAPVTGAAPAAAGADDAAQKRRRMQYDRMRELEAEVQRVALHGDGLKQSLRQAEAEVGMGADCPSAQRGQSAHAAPVSLDGRASQTQPPSLLCWGHGWLNCALVPFSC